MRHNNKYIKLIQIFISLVILLNVIIVRADYEHIYKDKLPINIGKNHRPQYIEGEYIIKYKDSISKYEKVNFIKKEKIDIIEEFDSENRDLIRVNGRSTLKSKIDKLERNPNIEYIEPNYLYYPMEIKDTRFNELWGLSNTGQVIRGTIGTPNVDIDILNAWQYTKGDEDVVVAVIDTGIDTAHPDLKERIWINTDEVLNGIDSDENGYIDDVHGWDFLNNDNTVHDYEDGDFHGTHVAGILSASLNDIGVAGVAPNVKIMPLKFLGTNEYGETVGSLSDVLKAIDYAKNKGVNIVNASWGNYEHSQILEDAIRESGMLFIVASGNETIDTDIKPSYPANFNLPNIISVGAIDNRGEYASFSNYGKSSVHVAAPGVDILSSIPLTRYKSASIYNYSEIYETFFQGFGLEIIDRDEDKIDIVDNVLSMLGISKENSILLVQDDESSNLKYKNCLEHYKNALNELEFHNVDVHKVNQHDNGPSFELMKEYDMLIWFTGEGFGMLDGSITTLTKEDQENLIKYLENGGELYLSGRDAGERIGDSRLFADYLAVKLEKEIGVPDEREGQWKNFVIGKEGTVFEKCSYRASNTAYSDVIHPLGNAKIVMVYGNSNTFNNSYMYTSGTSMATPYVTGIAALLKSLGEYDILSIKSLILRGTNYIQGIENKVLTSGIVNAAKAINKYLSGDTFYVKNMVLDIDYIELDTKFNKEYILEPIIIPINANDKRIKWISSDEEIATVDQQGRVKSIGKGKATITAVTLDGGCIDRCQVVVKDYNYPVAIDRIYFDNQTVSINLRKISDDMQGVIIVQAYDENNRPLKLMYSNEGILMDSYEFDFSNNLKPISYIKVFVWDGLDNMKPLAEPRLFKQ